MMEGTRAFRCLVCGYVHRGDGPPEECPVCGAAASDFEPHRDAPAAAAVAVERWRCLNCSYVHEGGEPPLECPVCGAPRDRFEAAVAADGGAGATDFAGHLVVVGAGIAGLSAIESFRSATAGGTVTLIAREEELPYYRLNLTRFLAGEIQEQDLPIHPAAWFSERNIDLRAGAEVAGISLEDRRVQLRGGLALAYDKLILTVGAHPFVPPFAGVQREGVSCLRTLRDARALLDWLQPGMACVVVGGGLLGLEAAGALAAQGARVTLLEGHDWLMPRQLNRRAGEILLGHVEGIGVRVRRNARTKEILGDERAAAVLLEDGASVPADLVVIAAGVRPNSHLGRRIGLDVNQGVIVDNHLSSSHRDLLAAGDVAEHRGVLYGSWAASQYQGSIAGLNAAGASVEFGGLPRSHTLKVLGLDLVSIGQVEPQDGSYQVAESDVAGAYSRFVFRDERLVGSVLAGDTSLAGAVKKALEEKRDFSGLIAAGLVPERVLAELRGE